MISRLPRRVSALVLAVLFLLGGVEDGFGAHVCPIHEAAAGAHAHDHSGADTDSSRHEHSGNEHSGDEQPQDAEDASERPCERHAAHTGNSDAHDESCTCIGACHAASGIALAAIPCDTTPAGVVATSSSLILPTGVSEPRHLPYFLPYALGPPTHG